MVYSMILKRLFGLWYGAPPEVSGEGWGLVLVADGVGGLDLSGTALRHVMGAQKLPFLVKVVPWGHGFGRWWSDLSDEANRDVHAGRVAEEVRAFRQEHPEAPVYLVGKSGGTGVVVKALEQLPPAVVDRAVLIAPALSPTYDLTRALRSVGSLVVFWSPLDLIILGAGTRIFGTSDRLKTVSAGLVSFQTPGDSPDEDRDAQYTKLIQVKWRPEMARTGYFGGHVGPDLPAFLRKYVVPLLVEKSTQSADSSSSQAGREPRR
jgi:pimeloyl-ACP methyl ester carboxylesterase